MYAYIRSKRSETGEVGTPYYIGIASNAQRPFVKRSRPVPPPGNRDFVRIIRRRLTWEEAGIWEKKFIAAYGLAHEGGKLRNRNSGGCGTRNAAPAVRAAAAERMRQLMSDPDMQEKMDKARRDPKSTPKRSASARAYFAQPGAREAHSARQKECSNRPETRAKMAAAKNKAFEEKLLKQDITREEYDNTRRGRNAAAVRRYRERRKMKENSEADKSVK